MEQNELAARIEAAPEAETWEALGEVWNYFCFDENMAQLSHRKLMKFRDANAPHDAAMMLLGEGCIVSRLEYLTESSKYMAEIINTAGEAFVGKAETIPPAIAAAAVRAGG